MTRALAVISLLTFGLPPAAAFAKVPQQETKVAPQHGAAVLHKKSAEAEHGGGAKAGATTVKAKAKVSKAGPAARRKTAAQAKHHPVSRRKTASRKTTPHGKAPAHAKAASHKTKTAQRRPLRELIADHSKQYSVPQHLVRRVIAAESEYNSKARNGPYIGLMQIALPTARGLGYQGTAMGLTDPDTNLKYGVAYLANAYRVAHGDEDAAVRLYRRGYYYEAKRQGMVGELIAAR